LETFVYNAEHCSFKKLTFLKEKDISIVQKQGISRVVRQWCRAKEREREREFFMDRGCRENREASGWERSSYDV